MARIYFGHPINTYDTALELKIMAKILGSFPGWNIENPNQPHHQREYKHWKADYGNGMEYYYKHVLPWCSAGIFLPFRDGKWGAGIFGEAEFLSQRNAFIYQITHNLRVDKIEDMNLIKVLSIEETRKRTRTEEGEIIPF